MWPPPTKKPYSRVTSDGRTIVDQEVLLSDPQVQADIEKIGRILRGRAIAVNFPVDDNPQELRNQPA